MTEKGVYCVHHDGGDFGERNTLKSIVNSALDAFFV